MNMWDCPSGRALRARLGERMLDGCHCLVVVPRLLDAQLFAESAREYLDFHMGSVCVFHVTKEEGLCQGLRNIIDSEKGNDASMDDLVFAASDCPYLVAFVAEDMDESGIQELQRDIASLAMASKHCRELTDTLNWRLLLLLPGMTGFSPQGDVLMHIEECWGWFKACDLEYAIEKHLSRYRGNPADYHWLYALCLGLARMDPELAGCLADAMPREMEDITEILREHRAHALAMEDKESVDALARDNRLLTGFWPDRPVTGAADACWRLGLYNLDCYGHPCIHPAALAAHKLSKTLEQQVVLGQIQLYLPLVQKVHHLVLRKVQEIKQRDPQACEGFSDNCTYDIGPLVHFLHTKRGYYSPELLELGSLWRKVRNSLAHNCFLSYEDAVSAYEAYESFDSRA